MSQSDESAERLIEQLDDFNWMTRRKACRRLGELGDARAVVPLLMRLTDPRWEVCQAALEALDNLGEGQLARAFLGVLEEAPVAAAELAVLAESGDLRAIEPLVKIWRDSSAPVRNAARGALETVSDAVEAKLGGFLCSTCLTTLAETEAYGRSEDRVSWYACRVCGKAGRVLAGIQTVVAVLDERPGEDLILSGGELRVNWLRKDELFDFDRVEIAQAGDYAVEKFCIAVANDTDEYRVPRYSIMSCAVARGCGLSENTLRVLRSMFGEVATMRTSGYGGD
jgi:hypothetical protein